MHQIVRCGVFCLLFSAAVASQLLDEPPQCSPYHFQEKVLEKVVRFEHEMQLQREKMSAWEKRVDEKIAALEEKEKMLAMTYKDLETKEKAVKDKMEKAVDQAETAMKTLTFNLTEEASTKLESIMKDGRPQTIAFKARGVTNTSPNSGDRLKFATEVLNIGNSYDKSTGIFTAPVGGVYMFTVQICTYNNKWYNVYIMANDVTVGTASHQDNDNTGTCTSGDGIAVLEKGDTVWIRCHLGSGVTVYEDQNNWNSFSGVLIGK